MIFAFLWNTFTARLWLRYAVTRLYVTARCVRCTGYRSRFCVVPVLRLRCCYFYGLRYLVWRSPVAPFLFVLPTARSFADFTFCSFRCLRLPQFWRFRFYVCVAAFTVTRTLRFVVAVYVALFVYLFVLIPFCFATAVTFTVCSRFTRLICSLLVAFYCAFVPLLRFAARCVRSRLPHVCLVVTGCSVGVYTFTFCTVCVDYICCVYVARFTFTFTFTRCVSIYVTLMQFSSLRSDLLQFCVVLHFIYPFCRFLFYVYTRLLLRFTLHCTVPRTPFGCLILPLVACVLRYRLFSLIHPGLRLLPHAVARGWVCSYTRFAHPAGLLRTVSAPILPLRCPLRTPRWLITFHVGCCYWFCVGCLLPTRLRLRFILYVWFRLLQLISPFVPGYFTFYRWLRLRLRLIVPVKGYVYVYSYVCVCTFRVFVCVCVWITRFCRCVCVPVTHVRVYPFAFRLRCLLRSWLLRYATLRLRTVIFRLVVVYVCTLRFVCVLILLPRLIAFTLLHRLLHGLLIGWLRLRLIDYALNFVSGYVGYVRYSCYRLHFCCLLVPVDCVTGTRWFCWLLRCVYARLRCVHARFVYWFLILLRWFPLHGLPHAFGLRLRSRCHLHRALRHTPHHARLPLFTVLVLPLVTPVTFVFALLQFTRLPRLRLPFTFCGPFALRLRDFSLRLLWLVTGYVCFRLHRWLIWLHRFATFTVTADYGLPHAPRSAHALRFLRWLRTRLRLVGCLRYPAFAVRCWLRSSTRFRTLRTRLRYGLFTAFACAVVRLPFTVRFYARYAFTIRYGCLRRTLIRVYPLIVYAPFTLRCRYATLLFSYVPQLRDLRLRLRYFCYVYRRLILRLQLLLFIFPLIVTRFVDAVRYVVTHRTVYPFGYVLDSTVPLHCVAFAVTFWFPSYLRLPFPCVYVLIPSLIVWSFGYCLYVRYYVLILFVTLRWLDYAIRSARLRWFWFVWFV